MKTIKNIIGMLMHENHDSRRSGWYVPLQGGTGAKGDAKYTKYSREAAQESMRRMYIIR